MFLKKQRGCLMKNQNTRPRLFYKDYEESNRVEFLRTTSQKEQNLIKQTLEKARLKKLQNSSLQINLTQRGDGVADGFSQFPQPSIATPNPKKTQYSLSNISSGFRFNKTKNTLTRRGVKNFAEALMGGLI